MPSLTVVTWNLLCTSRGALAIKFLDEQAEWDIACLQEVNPAAWNAIDERGWQAVNGLELAWEDEYQHWKKWPSASAVVARAGWSLAGDMMPGTPKPGRGIVAQAKKDGHSTSVISWHAPNASGEGIATKMAGYTALIKAIAGTEGPLVAGLDTNHWSPGVDLDLPPFDPLREDRYAVETQFFSGEPQHRLRDAYLDYLRDQPHELAEIVNERREGPLAVTYNRSGTDDRFDYIMISDEFQVDRVEHHWDPQTKSYAGSDHGLVSAKLRLL